MQLHTQRGFKENQAHLQASWGQSSTSLEMELLSMELTREMLRLDHSRILFTTTFKVTMEVLTQESVM